MKKGLNSYIEQQAEDKSGQTFSYLTNTTVNDLAYLNSQALSTEIIGDTIASTAHIGNTDFMILNYENLKATLGPRTDILLKSLLTQFSIQHPDSKIKKIKDGKAEPELSVEVPLKAYIESLGGCKTANRKTYEKTVTRYVSWQLALLNAISYDTIEYVNGHAKHGKGAHIIDLYDWDIEADYIRATFNTHFVTSLLTAPRRTTRLEAQKAIDPRNQTLYYINEDLYSYFSQYKNRTAGTANRQKVSTIFNRVPTLHKYDSAAVKKNGWVKAMCDPIEQTLDTMADKGLLEEWGYCHPKGLPLTDDEMAGLYDNFKKWYNTLIYFIPTIEL